MTRFPALIAALTTLACVLVTGSPAHASGSHDVLSYGDSLSVGTNLYLGTYLRGWNVRTDAAISTHADDVPGALRSFGTTLPRVVVVSAGTNDDPGRVSGFARIVREALAVAGPRRCVIWSTIVRPPYEAVSYAGYNRALATIARHRHNLRVFDWVKMADAHRSWFGSDGVHPTATGYRARAAAIARLVRSC
jgi:hypothetical protein